MHTARLRLCAVALLSAGIGLIAGAVESVARTAKAQSDASSARVPMKSHLGSYLAGRIARGLNETDRAVHFYRNALQHAPDSPRIVHRAFRMEATEGNWQLALTAARKLVKQQPNNRLARFWLGVAAFREGRLKQADKHFAKAATGPIEELTASLARAWIAVAMGKPKAAYAQLDVPKRAEWSKFYLQYHRALIADILGDSKIARQNYRDIFSVDSRTPRTTAAYIRHSVHLGNYRLAGQTARTHIRDSANDGHASVLELFEVIKAGKKLDLLVATPTAGLAEVFYGLGEALTSENATNLGTVYLQMALALRPDFPFALAALANAYETTKRYDRAIDSYDLIPAGSPLQASIDIRKAVNLNSMDRVDEAKAILDQLADKRPQDIRPLEALGNILRSRKRYREAITYYTRLLKLLPKERKQHWTYWYARGTSYERIKDWPNAEKDLLRAMRLDPDQALVLNYLGYSWVDQDLNLQRGLKLIRKAVSLKPDDGYIVDSLGWAYYRLGSFEKAAKFLERAVELRPEDPILNDHLGDALWRVGRRREARFQWEQALTLKPEKKDAVKIRRKLVLGLPRLPDVKAVDGERQRGKKVTPLGKRVQNNAGPAATAPVR